LKRVDWITLQAEVVRRRQAGDMVGLGREMAERNVDVPPDRKRSVRSACR